MAVPRRKPQPQIDVGTPERQRHQPAELVDTLETDPVTGRQILRRVARRPVTALDRLYQAGLLRSPADGADPNPARRRLEAGEWLLDLWHRCGFDRLYQAALPGSGGPAELSDRAAEALAWNRAVWRDAMAVLPRHAGLLRDLCLESGARHTATALRAALDGLADHRGL